MALSWLITHAIIIILLTYANKDINVVSYWFIALQTCTVIGGLILDRYNDNYSKPDYGPLNKLLI